MVTSVQFLQGFLRCQPNPQPSGGRTHYEDGVMDKDVSVELSLYGPQCGVHV